MAILTVYHLEAFQAALNSTISSLTAGEVHGTASFAGFAKATATLAAAEIGSATGQWLAVDSHVQPAAEPAR